jgi:hypothetical protein
MAKMMFAQPNRGGRNSDNMTPAQTIKQGEQAGILPEPKPRQARRKNDHDADDRPRRPRRARGERQDTPMQRQVRNLERGTAMY